MKLRRICLSLSGLAVIGNLAGCNPETFTFTPAEPKTVGFVNTIQGAKVWHDLNDNYVADANEPQATTDADGRYVLPQLDSAQLATHSLLAWVPAGAKNVDENTTVSKGYFLRAMPGQASIINPITTLAGEVYRLYPGQTAAENDALAHGAAGVWNDYPLSTNYSLDTNAVTRSQSAFLKVLANRLVARWSADFDAAASVVQSSPRLAALGIWGANFYWNAHFHWVTHHESDASKLFYRPLINPAELAANRNFFALPRLSVSNQTLLTDGISQVVVGTTLRSAKRATTGPGSNGLYALYRPYYRIWNPSTQQFDMDSSSPDPQGAVCYTLPPGNPNASQRVYVVGENQWVVPITRTELSPENCNYAGNFDAQQRLRITYYSNTSYNAFSRYFIGTSLTGLDMSVIGNGQTSLISQPWVTTPTSAFPGGRNGTFGNQALALEQSFPRYSEEYTLYDTGIVYFTTGAYGTPARQLEVTELAGLPGQTSLANLKSSYPIGGTNYFEYQKTYICIHPVTGQVACPSEVTSVSVRYQFGSGTNAGDLKTQFRDNAGNWVEEQTGRWVIKTVGGTTLMELEGVPDISREPTLNWSADATSLTSVAASPFRRLIAESQGSLIDGSYSGAGPTGQAGFWLFNNAAVSNMTSLY